jgi:DNA-binding NarL/FixJ family response regulator
MYEESQYAPRVLRAGARGYLMKSEGVDRVLAGIRGVLAGRVVVSEKMSSRMLEVFSGKALGSKGVVEKRLSDREVEILGFLGNAQSTRAIAQRLNLSVKTVEAHRANLKQKLGLSTSQELVRYAVCWVEESRRGVPDGGDPGPVQDGVCS